MMKVLRPLIASLVAGLAVATPSAGHELINFKDNSKLPPFVLPELTNGKETHFETASGRPAVLMFFSLSPAFREERSLKLAAALDKLQGEFKGRVNFAALLANDQSAEATKEDIASRKITIPVLDDGKHQVYDRYGVFMTPLAILIGKDGSLQAVVPYTSNIDDILANNLKFLLGEISKEQLQEALKPPQNVVLSPQQKEYIRRVNYGRVMLERKMLVAAQREFMTAAKIMPNAIEAQIGLGRVLFASGQTEQAEEAFQRALKIDKDSDEALAGLGLALFKTKAYDRAVPILENALLSPDPNLDVILDLADYYEKNGNITKSIRLNKLAIAKLMKRLECPSTPPAADGQTPGKPAPPPAAP
ncbi:MAG: tetratricopeptide repeat protein [Desulfobacteraceae bacterium]|nr:tetratricopeptide repeat protein [Desulfobacteraceae bacterium]